MTKSMEETLSKVNVQAAHITELRRDITAQQERMEIWPKPQVKYASKKDNETKPRDPTPNANITHEIATVTPRERTPPIYENTLAGRLRLRMNPNLAPDPIPLYITGLRRMTEDKGKDEEELINDLRENLPKKAVLGLSFVGGSVLEILTDRSKAQETLSTLTRIPGIRELKNFDIFADAMKKSKASSRSCPRHEKRLGNRCPYAEMRQCSNHSGLSLAHVV